MVKHGYSIEVLYHFSCGKCQNWWSIGDFQSGKNNHLTCPHCGWVGELYNLKDIEPIQQIQNQVQTPMGPVTSQKLSRYEITDVDGNINAEWIPGCDDPLHPYSCDCTYAGKPINSLL